jgi:hypothetical protein
MAVDSTSGARPPHRARWLATELTRKGGRRGGGGIHGEAAMAASGGSISALAAAGS